MLQSHRAWLFQQANDLFAFFEKNSIDPRGGFFELDDEGEPLSSAGAAPRGIHTATRMIHSFAIANLLGRPGADTIIDHGMHFLWNVHRDSQHGGYFWTVRRDGPVDDSKQAYGHAFVLLAASSAKVVGHPDADRLLADVSSILMERFWEAEHGAAAEQFDRNWKSHETYHGQNSNMHLTEALMAAYEATSDTTYLGMAERIADLIIRRLTAHNGWQLPEHFNATWQIDRDYSGDPMFRPYGTTPGHWLEWSRLLVQLWQLQNRKPAWLLDAAKNLFREAVHHGWDSQAGGFYYTLELDGSPRIRDRYWWPCCEGIGAAAFLNSVDDDSFYETWYRTIWNFSATYFIDGDHGGWRPQLDEHLKPNTNPFYGKPDIYHALQACLIPLLPTTGSITRGIISASRRDNAASLTSALDTENTPEPSQKVGR
jgi:mannose/cellobiose epimerase-like protein (N-acyl-D-glucosamine 2-epimerase family)